MERLKAKKGYRLSARDRVIPQPFAEMTIHRVAQKISLKIGIRDKTMQTKPERF
jgi:hypothetical protein